MIQIEMSKDINDFSPKIISIFDKRQLICLGISCSYGIPIMLYATGLDIETRITVAVLLMFPVLMCGWVKLYGMYLERFAWHILRKRILTPSTRYYKTENTYGYIDPTKPTAVKPALEKPIRRNRKEKRKYKEEMKQFEARK